MLSKCTFPSLLIILSIFLMVRVVYVLYRCGKPFPKGASPSFSTLVVLGSGKKRVYIIINWIQCELCVLFDCDSGTKSTSNRVLLIGVLKICTIYSFEELSLTTWPTILSLGSQKEAAFVQPSSKSWRGWWTEKISNNGGG
ncbi:hypothetical protein YC2023_031484 [Brassica napus]